jgi:hypothetical protein
MNHSIHSADRSTHLKVVVVALIAGIVFAGVGLVARSGDADRFAQSMPAIKAGKAVMTTSSDISTVR